MTRGARLRAWAVTSPAYDPFSDVRFRCGFHQWLRLFLLYTVVWSKHNFDNFHFLAKNQTPLKPYALIPIVRRNPATGDELIIAQRRRKHTETQYFTWFGKTAYIHGRESFYYRQRKDTINTWRRRHIHSTQLTVLAAVVAAWAAALSLFLFTSFSRSLYILLSHYKPPL